MALTREEKIARMIKLYREAPDQEKVMLACTDGRSWSIRQYADAIESGEFADNAVEESDIMDEMDYHPENQPYRERYWNFFEAE